MAKKAAVHRVVKRVSEKKKRGAGSGTQKKRARPKLHVGGVTPMTDVKAIKDDEVLATEEKNTEKNTEKSILVPIPEQPALLPPIKPTLDLKANPKDAETWLADAKEQERVLTLGDAVSPIRTAQLMVEAIPVIDGLVNPPPPLDTKKKKE